MKTTLHIQKTSHACNGTGNYENTTRRRWILPFRELAFQGPIALQIRTRKKISKAGTGFPSPGGEGQGEGGLNILQRVRANLSSRLAQKAFTLPEMMITMSLFMVVLGGLIVSHLCGLKMYEVTKVKLGASDDARKALSKLVDEVRSASDIVKVGTMTTSSSFTEKASGTPHDGNAIEIPTGGGTWVRYYHDANSNRVYRIDNVNNTVAEAISHSVTNNIVFRAEDRDGNVLNNPNGSQLIAVTFYFNQIEYPVVQIGPGHHFDHYQLVTKIAGRK